MPKTSYDAVVIGAGFAGASTALHLALEGSSRVLLVEREASAGLHSSGRSASIARQALADPLLARLAAESVEFLASPRETLAARAPGRQWRGPARLLDRCGLLLLQDDPEGGPLAEVERGSLDAGVAIERVEPPLVREMAPLLARARFGAALLSAGDGVVDDRSLLEGLLAEAGRLGAEIEFGRTVTGFLRDRDRVSGVRIGDEEIAAGAVVLAAGAWAAGLGSMAGAEEPPLRVTLRHAFLSEAVGGRPGAAVWHLDEQVYFRREGRGLLLSPCDLEDEPPGDPLPRPEAAALLRRKLASAFPGMEELPVAGSWAGLRVLTPDDRHVLGRDPQVRGLYWAAGLGGHGVTTAWGTGRIVADAVLGGEPVPAFDPARFFSPSGS